VLKKWNREADKNNAQATVAVLAVHYIVEKLIENGMFPAVNAKGKRRNYYCMYRKSTKAFIEILW
jgi:hypothetical protein